MTEQVETARPQLTAPAPPPRRWSNERILGHVLMVLWALAGAGLLSYMIRDFNPEFMDRYGMKFVSGFIVTIELVGLSLAIGAILSLPIAAMRLSSSRILGGIAYGFVYFFRGTPLIAQAFLVYYGAGSFRDFFSDIGIWWFFRDPWYCAVFAFSLNTSAYQAEILRGSIQNVARGQWEAASALGLSKPVTFWKIILPQALIVALRPYGNEVVLMIKGSAIASIITIYDLMGETRRAFSRSYDFQAYIWAAILYLVMVEALRRVWDRIEARLTRHLKR
ncbi:ABC transporter permease subunit [Stappia sp. GBMRC 2046]|uniref:ABC transporter permease subunit n=1 Tax=Stappia sediminis TaxID=2692190 RepID=A0A7X3LYF4_9HYPH|nr:ABC transporter permease [Stappia sediminis]MXN67405.1 ABC transporter permease subunit [Stappia sediminis]